MKLDRPNAPGWVDEKPRISPKKELQASENLTNVSGAEDFPEPEKREAFMLRSELSDAQRKSKKKSPAERLGSTMRNPARPPGPRACALRRINRRTDGGTTGRRRL